MDDAGVGCNAVMSPDDVEPWADPTIWAHLLPATHSTFLPRQYSSSNFGSVNIHYGASFLQPTERNGHTLHLQHTQKNRSIWLMLTIFRRFMCNESILAGRLAFTSNLLSWWGLDWKPQGSLADNGMGMTSLIFSHTHTGAPRFPCPAVLLPADDGNYFTQRESERDQVD